VSGRHGRFRRRREFSRALKFQDKKARVEEAGDSQHKIHRDSLKFASVVCSKISG
jgi:hypothetical protein